MNLQYLTESSYLLPVCSRVLYVRDAGLAISGGYYNPANCRQCLLKHCMSSTGKAMQFSGYLKRFSPWFTR